MSKINTKFVLSLSLACLLVLGGLCSSFAATFPEETKSKKDAKAIDTGINITLEEQNVHLKLGGRVFGDWMWGTADDEVEQQFGSLVSGNEWRAAWIQLNGDYGDRISFRVWYDLAGGTASAKDVWLGFNKLPFGSLRIGHFKEPFGLEMLCSNKVTVFMERSLANIFVPSRNTGIGVFGADGSKRFTWGVGVFTDADAQGKAVAHDDTYNFTARLTGLALDSDSALLHLGAAYHLRSVQDGGKIRLRARPEAHLAYSLVDTGSFTADSINMVGLEGAVLAGRLLVQGEYIGAFVDSPDLNDPSFNGFYVFGSYMLTNDKHGYNKGGGVVGGVNPSNPFYVEGGTGAWEVAVRYSQVDLDDDAVLGGKLMDVTVGINWYLNKYARIMGNYVYADRDDIGTANIFQMRYQFSF